MNVLCGVVELEVLEHYCAAPKLAARAAGYGPAIEYCVNDAAGHFLVGNDEYGSYVDFCPFCGEKAPVPIPLKPEPG